MALFTWQFSWAGPLPRAKNFHNNCFLLGVDSENVADKFSFTNYAKILIWFFFTPTCVDDFSNVCSAFCTFQFLKKITKIGQKAQTFYHFCEPKKKV